MYLLTISIISGRWKELLSFTTKYTPRVSPRKALQYASMAPRGFLRSGVLKKSAIVRKRNPSSGRPKELLPIDSGISGQILCGIRITGISDLRDKSPG